MKRYFYLSVFLLLTLILFSSCEVTYVGDNIDDNTGGNSNIGINIDLRFTEKITSIEFNIAPTPVLVAGVTQSSEGSMVSPDSGKLFFNMSPNSAKGVASISCQTCVKLSEPPYLGSKSCTLTLDLSQEQHAKFIGIINNVKLCNMDRGDMSSAAQEDSITATFSPGVMKIYRTANEGSSKFNYICGGGKALYGFLQQLLEANKDISTCPDTWRKFCPQSTDAD